MGRVTDDRDRLEIEPSGPMAAIDASDVAAVLGGIRASVHRWIDAIEDHLDEPRLRESDRSLGLAADELAERREELRAEAERRDREWAEHLDALEHDRRLLAEAWERLERLQVASSSLARPAPELQPAVPPAMTPRAAPSANDSENPVDQAILRQFEALRRDVRRNAEARRPS